jgi:hypothetical protein
MAGICHDGPAVVPVPVDQASADALRRASDHGDAWFSFAHHGPPVPLDEASYPRCA